MKTIQLATIGSGSIVHSFLDVASKTPGISCTAVYSRTVDKGNTLAKAYHISRVYTDLEQMLSDPDINFVYIASPNSLHYPQAKLALQHGKNVICEKPFCTKKEQANELLSLAKEKHLFLIDAVPTAFLPNFALIREQLPKIGRIRLVLCNYTQYSSRYDQLLAGQVTNVFDPKFAGGALSDINFYNVYFTVSLFGIPLDVQYFANIYPGLVDTSGILILRYADFISSLAGSKDAHGINAAQIEGEKGYLYVRNGSNGIAEVELSASGERQIYNLQPNPDRLSYEVTGITEHVLANDYDFFYQKLNTTLDVIDVMEQAWKSASCPSFQ